MQCAAVSAVSTRRVLPLDLATTNNNNHTTKRSPRRAADVEAGQELARFLRHTFAERYQGLLSGSLRALDGAALQHALGKLNEEERRLYQAGRVGAARQEQWWAAGGRAAMLIAPLKQQKQQQQQQQQRVGGAAAKRARTAAAGGGKENAG